MLMLLNSLLNLLLTFSFPQITPFHVAVEEAHIKIVDYLVGQGAAVDVQDCKKVSILNLY